jgi:hypothetical protein
MFRGEGSAPKGAHNWNRESASEAVKRMKVEQAVEQAELKADYRLTDIDRHIADLRQKAATPLNRIGASVTGAEQEKLQRQNAKYQQRYEQQAGVYTYMKVFHEAQTIGDVEEKVVRHQVAPSEVRKWLRGRMLENDDLLEAAIVSGYPQLRGDIEQTRQQQHWRHADSVSDFLIGLDVDKEDM